MRQLSLNCRTENENIIIFNNYFVSHLKLDKSEGKIQSWRKTRLEKVKINRNIQQHCIISTRNISYQRIVFGEKNTFRSYFVNSQNFQFFLFQICNIAFYSLKFPDETSKSFISISTINMFYVSLPLVIQLPRHHLLVLWFSFMFSCLLCSWFSLLV